MECGPRSLVGRHVLSGTHTVLTDVHCVKVWIYNTFTTDQMWFTCVCKYCICDISAVVNESFIFTMVLMSHIQYLHTYVHHI